jgi:hypothetical protein
MFSVLPLTTDIAQHRRHVGKVPILLQKSAALGGYSSVIRLRTTGFNLAVLILSTQLSRYAMH